MTLFMLTFIALIAWLYLYKTFNRLDILTLFVISYLLFFDLLTIIYIYKNDIKMDSLVSFFLLFYIFFSTFLIVFTSKLFLKKEYLESISFKVIIEKANILSDKLSILSFVIITMIVVYYFVRHNLIFRVSSEFSQSDILNTYGIIISTFVIPLYNMLLIISTSKLSNNCKKYRLFYFSSLLIIMIYFLLYGRREFILGILIIILISTYQKNSNLFSIKKIPLLLLSFFLIVVASNFYQNIRIQIAAYSITNNFVLKKSLLEYAFDFESSSKNIEDRTSIYDYTYLLMEKKLNNEFEPLYGEILYQSILNIIPSVLYPGKKVVNDDELINTTVKGIYSDMPNSVMASLLVDFGGLSYLIYPLFMITYIIITAFIIHKFRKNILLYLILVSIMIYSIFNVEVVIVNIFSNLRNMLILIVLMQIIYYLKNFLRKS